MERSKRQCPFPLNTDLQSLFRSPRKAYYVGSVRQTQILLCKSFCHDHVYHAVHVFLADLIGCSLYHHADQRFCAALADENASVVFFGVIYMRLGERTSGTVSGIYAAGGI